MTKAILVALTLSLFASGAMAQERATDAAIGAVSGAVVLGPIGAVAGALISSRQSKGFNPMRKSKAQLRRGYRSHASRSGFFQRRSWLWTAAYRNQRRPSPPIAYDHDSVTPSICVIDIDRRCNR